MCILLLVGSVLQISLVYCVKSISLLIFCVVIVFIIVSGVLKSWCIELLLQNCLFLPSNLLNFVSYIYFFCFIYFYGHYVCKCSLFHILFRPGWVAQLVEASSHAPKVCGFYPWSGHIPQVVGSVSSWRMYERQSISVTLLCPCFSLSSPSL